jgi:hypothetical protein
MRQGKGGLAVEHARDRPSELVCQDTPGCAFVRFFLYPGQRLLPRLMPAQAQGSCCRKGPLPVRVAPLGPCGAEAFPPGCFGTLDKTTRRRAILPPGAAVDVLEFVEQDEAADVANARHRL